MSLSIKDRVPVVVTFYLCKPLPVSFFVFTRRVPIILTGFRSKDRGDHQWRKHEPTYTPDSGSVTTGWRDLPKKGDRKILDLHSFPSVSVVLFRESGVLPRFCDNEEKGPMSRFILIV